MKVKTLVVKFDRNDAKKAAEDLDKTVNELKPADLRGVIGLIQDNVIPVSDHTNSSFLFIRTLMIKESKPG